MPCIYNETLHDKSGSFLASVSANITQLDEWYISIIRMEIPKPSQFVTFCRHRLPELDRYEVDRLLNQIYPESIQLD